MKNQLTPRINRLEKNHIIDGLMYYWPSGDSVSFPDNTNKYSSVLMKTLNQSSGMTMTASTSGDYPAGTELAMSHLLSKTSAGTLASNTIIGHSYFVEGHDARSLYRDESTLIFWVKSSIASTRSISFQNVTQSHSFVSQYTIQSANQWQLVAIKLPALNTCPGTIDLFTNIGLQINFNVIAGSTYKTSTLNQWQSGNFFAGSGDDTTWLTGTNHSFALGGIMLLHGDLTSLNTHPSSYRYVAAGRRWAEEMDMIGRYYENTYPDTNGRGWSPVGSTVSSPMYGVSRTDVGVPLIINWDYNTRKRTNPTVTLWNASTGAQGTWNDSGGATTTMTVFATTVSGTSFGINVGVINLRIYSGHAVADARF